jgi:methylmalonyl-CoA mutase
MQSLFTDFSQASKEEWKQKAIKDLKDRPLESLNWKLPEGFTLEPYFTHDTTTYNQPVAAHAAGKIPGGDPRQWDNLQLIKVEEEEEANRQALEALNGGATGLLFDLSLRSESLPKLEILLKGVEIPYCTVAFKGCVQVPNLFTAYTAYATQQGYKPEDMHGFIVCDLVSQLAETGIADHKGYEAWQTEFKKAGEYPNFQTLVIDLAPYHNAGANTVQELAVALSIAATYADDMTEKGVEAGEIFNRLGVFTAVGNRYFVEIAKLQSLRYLIKMLAKAYGLDDYNPSEVTIHATSSRREVSVLDENTNLLRYATQAMSAVLGGCNSLTLDSFRSGESTTLSRRMARNVSIILQEESYFGKVLNPVDGTYYLRQLQGELVEQAWQQFLSWEEAGGYRKLVESGQLLREIAEARQASDKLISQRREKVVGATAYANTADQLKANTVATADNGEFLSIYRKARNFEQARLSAQELSTKINKPLAALLLQFGDATMQRARAAFAADFLRAGGWQTAESTPAENPEELSLEEFQLVVLCAADEDYNEQAAALADDLRENGYSGEVYVAGNPDTLDESVKNAALDGFINLKSDAPAVYNELLNQVSLHHEA